MAQSKYIDHIQEISEMQDDGKTIKEIVKYLNMNYRIKATENSLTVFLRRYHVRNNKAAEKESQEKTEDLSELFEKMEKKHSMQKEESVLHGMLMKNLEIIKDEYQEMLEKFDETNDKFDEAAKKLNDQNDRNKYRCLIASGWILTILVSMFGGYYIGRCYTRTAFHYALTLTGIPAGMFFGYAVGFFKRHIKNKKETSKEPEKQTA